MRATVMDSATELRIELFAKKGCMNFNGVIASSVCLFGNVIVSSYIIFHHDSYLLFFLLLWNCLSIQVIVALLWKLTGKEIIIVSQEKIKYEQQIVGISWEKKYELLGIKWLRKNDITENQHGYTYDDLVGSKQIIFDYNGKTAGFCRGADDEETQYILGLLQKRKTKCNFISAHKDQDSVCLEAKSSIYNKLKTCISVIIAMIFGLIGFLYITHDSFEKITNAIALANNGIYTTATLLEYQPRGVSKTINAHYLISYDKYKEFIESYKNDYRMNSTIKVVYDKNNPKIVLFGSRGMDAWDLYKLNTSSFDIFRDFLFVAFFIFFLVKPLIKK